MIDTEDDVPSMATVLAAMGDCTIGTFRQRRSGRMEMVLNGDVYHVNQGTAVQCVQHVVAVDTDNATLTNLGDIQPHHRYTVVPHLRDMSTATH